jgi:hypothetical protein
VKGVALVAGQHDNSCEAKQNPTGRPGRLRAQLRCNELTQMTGVLCCRATAAAAAARAAAAAAAAAGANGSTDSGYRKQDAAFARNVGQAVVDWILERLSDYHSRSVGGVWLGWRDASVSSTAGLLLRGLLTSPSVGTEKELLQGVQGHGVQNA